MKLVRSNERPNFEGLVSRRNDTHVLTGFLHHPVIADAFYELSRTGARIHLQSESVDVHGIKGIMRLVRDRVKAGRHMRHISGVLAIGTSGVRYFERLGFERGCIIPFGYFVAAKGGLEAPSDARGAPPQFRIAFAGQLIRRKGLDILFDALGRVRDLGWSLDLIGSGPLMDSLKRLATEIGITDRIAWQGPVAPEHIHGRIAGADLFVLPSRWDGWGVVVNESLAAGVPVVCSDRCGASCVLKSPGIGEIFPAGDVDALGSILRRRISAGRLAQESRVGCRAAAAALTPEAGARHFLDGLAAIEAAAMPPPPPWMRHLSPLPS
ncbi:MAG TPA: glycosyltransferase family 4 protein [Opitutaceae bacterium]|nr:glycosyltransferase family 4 protein [Opitutaceae bacterium]